MAFRPEASKENRDPLSPGPGDVKMYCPGVGIVVDDVISIVEVKTGQ